MVRANIRSLGVLLAGGLLAGGLLAAVAAAPAWAGSVTLTNLTSDGSVAAAFTDTKLLNAWGMSYSPTGPWWLSSNGAGVSTVYDGTGKPFPAATPLVVTIPSAAGDAGTSSPTGQVFNASTSFVISSGAKSAPALFLFATENGTISGWSPQVDPAKAINVIDASARAKPAVYKGLALANISGKRFLLAADFRGGTVEVYDGNFALVTKFRDPLVGLGYGPFNVAVLKGNIYVAYAKKSADGFDDVPGLGHGVVEQVDINGNIIRRIQFNGPLNSPWGMALAPSSWGKYAGDLLVGNFGDGHIIAYNASTGVRVGQLTDYVGAKIAIPGLWGLMVGNNGLAGVDSKVYFTAGPNGEAGGLFGSLTFAK